MHTYLLRRILQTLPVLVGVALIAFVFSELAGSPIRGLLGQSTSEDIRRKVEAYYGFDKSRPERFLNYMQRLSKGDLGVSIVQNGEPVTKLLLGGLAVTAKLALGAIFIAIVLGVSLGILAARRPNSLIDYGASIFASVGVSFPAFFLGILLIMVFSVRLKLLPIGGYEEGQVKYLILPCVSLGLISTASIARLTRNCMIEALSKDFVRLARAKGVSEWSAVLHHALTNALVPVITVIGNDFASLLTGAVLTETVFGLPGIGLKLSRAIFSHDLPVVMGACVVLSLVFVVANLLVDLSYSFLDPRIRYGD